MTMGDTPIDKCSGHRHAHGHAHGPFGCGLRRRHRATMCMGPYGSYAEQYHTPCDGAAPLPAHYSLYPADASRPCWSHCGGSPHVQHQNRRYTPRHQMGNAVDDEMAFVEHEWNKNENSSCHLKAQGAKLSSGEQKELQEERQQEYQDMVPGDGASQASKPSVEPTRVIQGTDGRFHRVVAAVEEDPSHDTKPRLERGSSGT